MHQVKSADGTVIAYDLLGEGPPVIAVGGATCDRGLMRPLAQRLAHHATVVNYDRRGRGGSGDTPPYALAREVEDIAALLDRVGGSASVYGHSSGAGLALHAAASGLSLTSLVLHEPPFVPDQDEQRRQAREYDARLRDLLAQGRREEAVALFFATVGVPPEAIDGMRQEPRWRELAALAPTLAYDSAAMGSAAGGTGPIDLAARVSVPTLVISGGASPEWMIGTNRLLAGALPHGRHRVLDGQEHVVDPAVLVPVLSEFLSEPFSGR